MLDALKAGLEQADRELARRFAEGEPVDALVAGRARAVEQWLIAAWEQMMPATTGAALVAVGGFGRGELHPHSDVDLMILVADAAPDAALRRSIEAFFTLLWDAGLYLGHSVRTPAQCEEEARADVAIATNLMESRLLAGVARLFEEMRRRTRAPNICPGPEFFEAKFHEQAERHARFNDTAYKLEPNIKEGPGGLRDIQMISWVCKRHFQADSLHALVEHGFLTEAEYADLYAGQQFLWRLRFALHLLAGRGEDRLLFDYQREIARLLGFGESSGSNAAVEAFMQHYYRVVMQLERLNETLLQLFREQLLGDGRRGETLGAHYLLRAGYLDVQDPKLFERRPEAMLDMFVLLAKRPDISGVRATLIRLVRDNVHRIDEDLRQSRPVLDAFLELLRQPQGVYSQLQRMNRYGVLAALLPAFARITGRMQFDLFHVYTVDQHILFVIRNLRRFAHGKYAGEFPHMAGLFREVDKPELLYLAALFHDIAKGRGGDHSELGARDAREFCTRLGLPEADCDTVAWLVKQHLLMSQTAQRKDIADPEIVAEFVATVQTTERLVLLYLLTVADIAATSPKLWNGWKAGLLHDLYTCSRAMLEGDEAAVTDRAAQRARTRSAARDRLLGQGFGANHIESFWDHLPGSAFQRLSQGQLAWATAAVLAAPDQHRAVVAVRARPDLGISEVLVSAPDYTGLFASTTSVLDEMGLNVLAARVFTTSDERSFDLFQVMDSHGRPMPESDAQVLAEKLCPVLEGKRVLAPLQRPLPRRLRHFVIEPQVRFGTGRGDTVTELEVVCSDRPGILSQLAAALVACEISIHDAMIATFGERVEDTFLVTDREHRLLDETQQQALAAAIREKLEASETTRERP
jgi:[protein-PII] uridylyltransferase